MANYLDYLLEKWINPKKQLNLKENIEASETKEEEPMIDYGDHEDEKIKDRNFVEENKGLNKNFITKSNKKSFIKANMRLKEDISRSLANKIRRFFYKTSLNY